MKYKIECGDILEWSRNYDGPAFHGIMCDPPYGLSFMGKKWDYDVPSVEVWRTLLGLCVPGAHLLSFGGSRTYHRMACAVEDGGWEIRDQLMWVYGSGFPKSLNLHGDAEGYGTALKPAHEPLVLARKPLDGTVAENVQRHGAGALNIDVCRVGDYVGGWGGNASFLHTHNASRYGGMAAGAPRPTLGRWPANLIHDGSDEVVGLFPQASGQQGDLKTTGRPRKSLGRYGDMGPPHEHQARVEEDKCAARFFQQCKGDYNEIWQDLNLPLENVNTAEQNSSQQRQSAASALVLAVNLALPEGLRCSGLYLAPSTHATGRELKQIADSVTQTIQTIGPRFWLGPKPAKLSLSLSHASVAVNLEQTGTMTITVSRWRSDGFAEDVTFSITSKNLEAGERDCVQFIDGKRLIYCAKASKSEREAGLESFEAVERVNGNKWTDQDYRVTRGERPPSAESGPRKNIHPTVKPLALTEYLSRLILPPQGAAPRRLLVPFAGSGSEVIGAVLAGWDEVVGVEMDAEYCRIMQARLQHWTAKQVDNHARSVQVGA